MQAVQACARYKCVDSQCVCTISFLRPILSNLLKYTHKYIYMTTLLPPASAQAVFAGETHSCDVSALRVPVYCAPRHRRSPRCLFFIYMHIYMHIYTMSYRGIRCVVRIYVCTYNTTYMYEYVYTIHLYIYIQIDKTQTQTSCTQT